MIEKKRKEKTKQNLYNKCNLDCIMLNTDVSNEMSGLIIFLELSKNILCFFNSFLYNNNVSRFLK